MQHCQSRKVWAVKDKLDQATAVLRRERLQNKQELEKHKSLATIAVGETAIVVPLSLSIAVETPTKGRGVCSRMTVSPTARPRPPSR